MRNDTGVFEGGEISIFYDPMIAKLVTHGKDREQSIEAMSKALDAFRIDGIRHNIDFVAAIMAHDRFKSGVITTAFIAEEYPDGFEGAPLSVERAKELAAIGYMLDADMRWRASQISQSLSGHEPAVGAERAVQIEGHVFALTGHEDGCALDGNAMSVAYAWQPGDLFCEAHVNGQHIVVAVDRTKEGFTLTGSGRKVDVSIRSRRAQELMQYMPEKSDGSSEKELLCPMPGMVIAINVTEGQEVKAGEALGVVEAMKMENILRAERDVKITKILCAVGDKLAVDDVMIEFE